MAVIIMNKYDAQFVKKAEALAAILNAGMEKQGFLITVPLLASLAFSAYAANQAGKHAGKWNAYKKWGNMLDANKQLPGYQLAERQQQIKNLRHLQRTHGLSALQETLFALPAIGQAGTIARLGRAGMAGINAARAVGRGAQALNALNVGRAAAGKVMQSGVTRTLARRIAGNAAAYTPAFLSGVATPFINTPPPQQYTYSQVFNTPNRSVNPFITQPFNRSNVAGMNNPSINAFKNLKLQDPSQMMRSKARKLKPAG